MNIALGRTQDDLAQSLALGTALQHLRFKNAHGSLHRLGRGEQVGQEHLSAAELIAGERDSHSESPVHRFERIDAIGQSLPRQFLGCIGRAIDDALKHRSEQLIRHRGLPLRSALKSGDPRNDCIPAGRRKTVTQRTPKGHIRWTVP